MPSAAVSPVLTMNDGHRIPQLGLGVYKVPDEVAATVVASAIDAGYRHIDTATLYDNESGVGAGVRVSAVPREELFVTSKIWQDDQGYDETLRAADLSLGLLGLDYLDLYLIHWPAPSLDRYVQTWQAMETLKADGRVRSIGVSNFHPHHLDRLLDETTVVPALNQVELHPWLPQRTVRQYDARHGILTESWSPLARGRAIGEPTLDRIGEKHGVTAAQVVIRWHLQLGLVVIPKSVSAERIRQNADVFSFELDVEDIAAIATLESGERTGKDPDDS